MKNLGRNTKALLLAVTLTLSGSVYGSCRGDLNNDHIIDSADFVIFRSTFNLVKGQPGYVNKADLKHDHKIDSADFVIFRSLFNTTCPGYGDDDDGCGDD